MSIIKEMYDNNLLYCHRPNSREYEEALNKANEMEYELLRNFPECKELFSKYQLAETELMEIDIRQQFVKGFQFGGKVVMEIMTAKINDEK